MTDVAVPLRETRARRVPAVLTRVNWPLVALFVLAAVWTAWFALQCKQYFIQPDELEYVKQARRIAEELHPLLPGDRYFGSWSQLQPFLLAPVWALQDPNTAHTLMGAVNAVIMASVAFPAYLLAGRVLGDRRAALLVAVLSVVIPWMAAASTMMTEVAAYPAFVWGALAVQHAIARPSPRADLIGLAGAGLAFSARPQLAVLGPALVLGVLVQELRFAPQAGEDPLVPRATRLRQGLLAAVRAHWILLALAVVAGLGWLVVRPDIFGGYSDNGVTSGALSAPGLLNFSRETLAYIAVGVGLLPLALGFAWALLTLRRPLTREQHAFALLAVVSTVLLTLAVGSFTARFTPQGINSRYLFYLAPLLFIGMVALVRDRRPATIPLLAGAALVGWVVYGAKLAQTGPSLVSPDQTFHTVLVGRTYQVGHALGMPRLTVAHLLGVLAIAAVSALALLRRGRHARAVSVLAVVLVTLFCVVETGYSLLKIAATQKGVDRAFIDGRTWVDDALPAGAKAQVILSTFGDVAAAIPTWWDVSYWNSQVDRSMTLPVVPDLQQPFPQQFQVLADFGTFSGYTQGIGGQPGSVGGPGIGPGPWFVKAVSDRTFGFRDEQVVAERFGIRLLKVASPPRAAWALFDAADDTGRLAAGAPPARLRLYAAKAGTPEVQRLRLVMTTSPDAARGYRFALSGADAGGAQSRVVAKGRTAVVSATVRIPKRGWIELHLRAAGPKPPPATPLMGLQLTEVSTRPGR